MTDLGKAFLIKTLGNDGACALSKAVEREPELASIIVPRAVLAWIGQQGLNYEGGLPGHENSYLTFSKSDGVYSGVIALEQGPYHFDGATVYHLAASITMSLGVDGSIDSGVRDVVLAKLGKSIDTLVKAQSITTDLKKAEKPLSSHGDYSIEKSALEDKPYRVVHKNGKVVQKGISNYRDATAIAEWHKKNGLEKASEAPGPAHAATAQEGPLAPIPPQKQPKQSKRSPALSVSKSEAHAECPVCGGYQYQTGRFVGCMCIRDLKKSVTSTAYSDGYVLEFNELDDESIRTIVKAFRRSK